MDLEQRTLQTIDNPFGTKLYPCLWYKPLPVSSGWTFRKMVVGEEQEQEPPKVCRQRLSGAFQIRTLVLE